MAGSNKTKAGYILNLLALRAASLSVPAASGGPIPFWNFFNAMPYGAVSQYDISEAELRWQVKHKLTSMDCSDTTMMPPLYITVCCS